MKLFIKMEAFIRVPADVHEYSKRNYHESEKTYIQQEWHPLQRQVLNAVKKLVGENYTLNARQATGEDGRWDSITHITALVPEDRTHEFMTAVREIVEQYPGVEYATWMSTAILDLKSVEAVAA